VTTIRVTRRPRGSGTDVDGTAVVPPGATRADAGRAVSAATDRAGHDGPTALLGGLGMVDPGVPAARSAADPSDVGQTGVWDSEGGHPSR
jgi:hypothetical protein